MLCILQKLPEIWIKLSVKIVDNLLFIDSWIFTWAVFHISFPKINPTLIVRFIKVILNAVDKLVSVSDVAELG